MRDYDVCYTDGLPFETLEFDVKMAHIKRLIDPDYILANVSFEVVKDYMSRGMMMEMRVFLLRDKHTKPITISFPETWIDAFKKRFFPKWLESKFPVKYTTITIHPEHIYPEYHIKELGKKVTYLYRSDE